jgi:hypothetical protein
MVRGRYLVLALAFVFCRSSSDCVLHCSAQGNGQPPSSFLPPGEAATGCFFHFVSLPMEGDLVAYKARTSGEQVGDDGQIPDGE